MTGDPAVADSAVRLRPAAAGELPPDSSSRWDDWGDRDGPPPADLHRMLVEVDGAVVGDVSWHSVWYGPNEASRALNIGISLIPAARGRGLGTRAQRALLEHLFTTTGVQRVEASTDVDNVAEQRSLEKAGFRRDGLLRSAQGRADGRHDLVVYLFATTAVNRVEAATDLENTAEQRSLEKAGFRREGVLRGSQFRGGSYHDLVYYAVLRDEVEATSGDDGTSGA